MKLGIIGLGKRIEIIVEKLKELQENIEIVAVCDINKDEAMLKIKKENGIYREKVLFYENADEMLDLKELDGVIIGTNCDTHTKLAIKVMKMGLPMFLEKPVSISYEELKMLNVARLKYNPRVVVSFPLRVSDIAMSVKEIIKSGKIGTVEQAQLYNDVPYGRVYYHDWYRNDQKTGGLWLQKATHDFDYLNYIVEKMPVEICAMDSKQIFKGEKPANLKCDDCDCYKTCNESPYNVGVKYQDDVIGKFCCYAVDTGNHDSATAIIRYDSGMHASYSQNFFARKRAARRGGRFYGYNGTLEFDWYQDEIKVFMHTSSKIETYKFENKGKSHFGGDDKLVANFIEVIKGGKSISTLEDGILSAAMSLSAKKSALENLFVKIPKL